jgi:ABC-type polysaccharide/polyol phosphate export permease
MMDKDANFRHRLNTGQINENVDLIEGAYDWKLSGVFTILFIVVVIFLFVSMFYGYLFEGITDFGQYYSWLTELLFNK